MTGTCSVLPVFFNCSVESTIQCLVTAAAGIELVEGEGGVRWHIFVAQ